MTTIAHPAARQRLVPAGWWHRRRAALSLSGAGIVVAALALWSLSPEQRPLAAPMFAIAETALVFVLTLWARDGIAPIFEAGTLCMLAIAAYGTLPLIGFLVMHGDWAPFADSRLFAYPFNPRELGAFGWRYAVYAVSFALTYLAVRGRAAVRSTAFHLPPRSTRVALLAVFVALYAAKLFLKIAYNYDLEDPTTYVDPAQAAASVLAHSLLLRQIGHNIYSALFLVQQGLILLLLAYWRRRWCRVVLFVWLVSLAAGTVLKLGARSGTVLLLLAAGVLYHRLVKPVGFRLAIAGGTALLSGFLLVGALRGFRGNETQERGTLLASANEFQGLFTTAFDIHKRREAGELPPIPWQLYVSDLYLPIPSQVLPFEKLDPAIWYIDVIGATGSGVGFMFGVMSQAMIGLDWIELVLRGALLAVFLALLHRWYVGHAQDFWSTLFYLFIGLWTYLTFRATTFYFCYYIFYQFLPVWLVTTLLAVLLSRVRAAVRQESARP